MKQLARRWMQSGYALPSEHEGEDALFAKFQDIPRYSNVIEPKADQGRIIVTAPDLGST